MKKIVVMLTGQLRQTPGKVIMTLIALSLGNSHPYTLGKCLSHHNRPDWYRVDT